MTTFDGVCPLCEKKATFELNGKLFRDAHCPHCASHPRQRDLFHTLQQWFPQWRAKVIHECSPGWDQLSRRLFEECANYTATHYDTNVPFGTVTPTSLPCKRYRSENLELQTFEDSCFDLVIMQDVFEHVFDPLTAAKEIARTLKPLGALLMAVPVVNKVQPTVRRAKLENGEIKHLLPAQYHGNPIDKLGSLVTIDWGYDIGSILSEASGLHCIVLHTENLSLGIRDECNEIVLGLKWRSLPL